MSSTKQRIVELETKLSFQEHLIQDLDEALTRQQRQLDMLQHTLNAMYGQLGTELTDAAEPSPEEIPPPHY